MLRTLSTILVIPTILLFWLHSITQSLFLMGFLGYDINRKIIAYILAALILIHAVIGIILMIKKLTVKGRKYLPLNKSLIIQTVSGIGVLAVIYFHITAFNALSLLGGFVLRTPDLTFYLVNTLLVILIGLHCAVGLHKLCISFGLVTRADQLQKIIPATAIIACTPAVISIIAFSIYYIPAITGAVL